MYIGGGAQAGLTYDHNIYQNVEWSGGLGADYAVGPEGAGAQVTANTDSVNVSGSARIPHSSWGIGASGGIDGCLNFKL